MFPVFGHIDPILRPLRKQGDHAAVCCGGNQPGRKVDARAAQGFRTGYGAHEPRGSAGDKAIQVQSVIFMPEVPHRIVIDLKVINAAPGTESSITHQRGEICHDAPVTAVLQFDDALMDNHFPGFGAVIANVRDIQTGIGGARNGLGVVEPLQRLTIHRAPEYIPVIPVLNNLNGCFSLVDDKELRILGEVCPRNGHKRIFPLNVHLVPAHEQDSRQNNQQQDSDPFQPNFFSFCFYHTVHLAQSGFRKIQNLRDRNAGVSPHMLYRLLIVPAQAGNGFFSVQSTVIVQIQLIAPVNFQQFHIQNIGRCCLLVNHGDKRHFPPIH